MLKQINNFSGKLAKENKKKVKYVTERSSFELKPEGLTLVEIAPGIDIEKDILGQMEFKPLISDELKTMDAKIFRAEKWDQYYNFKYYFIL